MEILLKVLLYLSLLFGKAILGVFLYNFVVKRVTKKLEEKVSSMRSVETKKIDK